MAIVIPQNPKDVLKRHFVLIRSQKTKDTYSLYSLSGMI